MQILYLRVYKNGQRNTIQHQSTTRQSPEYIASSQTTNTSPPVKMNKLLGQRKKFNLNLSSSSSSDDDQVTKPVVLNRFNISLSVRDDGSLLINSTKAEDTTDINSSFELPKVRRQRSLSQRSTSSQRSNRARTPSTLSSEYYVDQTSSDDEAFMNNEDNFIKSPRPLRRSLRKRKTSSLKRRPGVQTVPENEHQEETVQSSAQKEDHRRVTVSSLDDTIDQAGDLSIEWIENEYYSDTQSSESTGCNVISERSLIIANAETEDALSDFSDATGIFKMPYPVSYRPNLAKRKLVVESDEEYISKTFRAPIKRTCIRYYY